MRNRFFNLLFWFCDICCVNLVLCLCWLLEKSFILFCVAVNLASCFVVLIVFFWLCIKIMVCLLFFNVLYVLLYVICVMSVCCFIEFFFVILINFCVNGIGWYDWLKMNKSVLLLMFKNWVIFMGFGSVVERLIICIIFWVCLIWWRVWVMSVLIIGFRSLFNKCILLMMSKCKVFVIEIFLFFCVMIFYFLGVVMIICVFLSLCLFICVLFVSLVMIMLRGVSFLLNVFVILVASVFMGVM